MTSDRAALLAALHPYIDRARSFTGWDFASVAMHHLDSPEPWDYVALARAAAAQAERVVDLGTGGGERYLEIATGLPGRFVATEEWPPNARVAGAHLRPRGIGVVQATALCLPFAAASFDLVLSRHEAIDPAEVDRLLQPGGTFLTQQVTHDTWPEVRRHFPRTTVFHDHYNDYAAAFDTMGFEVTRQRHERREAYATLGDVVFMLLTAPWFIPDLDPEADLDALLALEAATRTEDGLVLTEGRYLLRARKPV